MIKDLQNFDTHKIELPISLLVLGRNKKANLYINNFLDHLKIKNFDVMRVRSEESEGKSDIISIKQIIQAQRFINLTPHGSYKALVIENANKMNKEASNSLLKTLEEPPKYATIILQSEKENLLPTIISRCQCINLISSEELQVTIDIPDFINKPFYEQSKLIESIVNEKGASDFLTSFETQIRKSLRKNLRIKDANFLKEIVAAKNDIKHNVNARLVLESLILRYKYYG